VQLADIDIEQGKFASAEKRLRRVEAIAPESVEIALVKSKLLFKMKRIEEIPALLEPFRSGNLGNGKVQLLLAEALLQQDQLSKAIAVLEEGLDRWPRHPELAQSYTLYQGLAGNYKEAIRIMEEMQTYPHKYNQLFYHRLRAYYFQSGQMDKFRSYPHNHSLKNR